MLVYHKYTDEVILSFLLVGHTHEDIDQLCRAPNKCSSDVKRV